jgi:hypothetical protein
MKQVKSGSGDKRKSEKLFSVTASPKNSATTPPSLAEKLGINNGRTFPWPEQFIDIQEGTFEPISCHRDVAVVYFRESDNCAYNEREEEIFPYEWEAILLITKATTSSYSRNRNWTGCIHARHGGSVHKNWWIQQQPNTGFVRCCKTTPLSLSGVLFAVYRRRNVQRSMDLQRRYLTCLGGQTSVYCAHHSHPLITAPDNKSKCCCNGPEIFQSGKEWESISQQECGREAEYMCPESNCCVAICAQDIRCLSDQIGGAFYVLADTFCRYLPSNDLSILSKSFPRSSNEEKGEFFRPRNLPHSDENDLGYDSDNDSSNFEIPIHEDVTMISEDSRAALYELLGMCPRAAINSAEL